jgi:hypothetical protein
VPYRLPKSLRIAGALALAAFGLFALRYGLSRSLDLRPPIARIVFEGYFGSQSREIAALEKRAAEKRELGPNGVLSVEDQGANPAVEPEGDGSVSGSAETPGSEATTRPPSVTQESGAASDEPPANQNDGPSSGDSRDDRGDEAGSSQDPPAQPGAKRPPSSPNEDSDLINKLRDAMADLLAKLKIQPPVTESREVAAKSGASQKGRSGQPKNRQPAQGPGGRQSSEAQGSQQPGEQGESAETAQSAQGQSGEQGSGQPDPRGRERSGMGKEDGSKDIKEAEQLAAMGKISEILGKRAQNLTGEVMVEVTSSQNQQLRTPYSQRRAQHADTGGEIHRDEIPLIFQHYVQRYYEEVRKSPPPAAVPAKPTAPGAGR